MNFATFDLNLLRILNALLMEGSTVKAGERLGLSQSAVSGALSRLRAHLGDPLFVRHGNRLVPTAYCEGLSIPLRSELEKLEQILTPPTTFDPLHAVGRFKIAGSDFFSNLLMPDLAQDLNRNAPNLTAQLVDLIPSDYVRSLEAYSADLILAPDLEVPAWVFKASVFRSGFVVISDKGNPALRNAESDDSATFPMDSFCSLGQVVFSPEGKTRTFIDTALEQVGRNRRVVLTVPVFSGVYSAVSGSNLIAMIPRQLAEKVAPKYGLAIRQPPVDIEPALIVACWHKRLDNSPQHRYVREKVFTILRSLNGVDRDERL